MNECETAKAINDSATDWVARIDKAQGDPKGAEQAQAELAVWLAGDARRRGAYFRARAAWHMLDRASVLRSSDSGLDEMHGTNENNRTATSWLTRRRMLLGTGSLAASVAAVVSGVILLNGRKTDIQTAVGEIRRIPLDDGSLAQVNTSSHLEVALQENVRQISLQEGEAWFKVAHDSKRPFVVAAGDVRVRAVGTGFSVRRNADGAIVQVTEGTVEVWSVGSEAEPRLVSAGSRTFVSDIEGAGVVARADEEIERKLSWREGQLIFDGDTLAEAAAEFNRYNKLQVIVEDPVLGEERLVGRFRTDEPVAFVRAVANMLGAKASIGSKELRLSQR